MTSLPLLMGVAHIWDTLHFLAFEQLYSTNILYYENFYLCHNSLFNIKI